MSEPGGFDPRKWLRFLHLTPFVADCRRLGLDDEAVRAIERSVLEDPERWPVMASTGGLRKMRFAPPDWHAGKRGALRVCYSVFPAFGTVALIVAYAKNEQANLTAAERRTIKALLAEIVKRLEQGG